MAFGIPNEPSAAFADQAEPDSVDFDVLVAGLANNGVISGCAVTAQGTPDMTVAVAAGSILVAGTSVAVAAGNVTIGAAHATNPRFDLVVVNNSGTKSVTAGTASANPVFPAIPANSVVLAAVYVPANDSAINSNQIVDKRIMLPASISTAWTSVVKITDEPITSDATLSTDAALKFTMAASTKYRIRGRIFLSTSTNADFKWRHAGPASPTLVLLHRLQTTPGGSPVTVEEVDTAYSAADITMTSAGAWTNGYIEFEAIIYNGTTAGDFQFQWAQNASHVDQTTVKAGSYLEYAAV